ncbi:MAG: hypothetical protein WCW52_07020 [Elusimicrobiales bacterium]|jgi:hypothetical protein
MRILAAVMISVFCFGNNFLYSGEPVKEPFYKYLECYKALVGVAEGRNYMCDNDGRMVLIPARRGANEGFYLFDKSGAVFQPLEPQPADHGKTDYYYDISGAASFDIAQPYLIYSCDAGELHSPGIIASMSKAEGLSYVPVRGKKIIDAEAKHLISDELYNRILTVACRPQEVSNMGVLDICRSVPDRSIKAAISEVEKNWGVNCGSYDGERFPGGRR